MFLSNRKLKRTYDWLFREDPLEANIFLLLTELADEKGEINFNTPFPEEEIQHLMIARFNNPKAYQLQGGLKR